jgi:hypothetical protein
LPPDAEPMGANKIGCLIFRSFVSTVSMVAIEASLRY